MIWPPIWCSPSNNVRPAFYAHIMLSDRDRQLLDLERRTWRFVSSKQEAQRELFGNSIRASQRLNALLDDPEALAYAPAVVKRLRRRREARGGRRVLRERRG